MESCGLWETGSFARDGPVMVMTSGFVVVFFGCLCCFVGYEVFRGDSAWECCWVAG